jgi:hypothetical protein
VTEEKLINDGPQLEQVDQFRYLGVLVNDEASCYRGPKQKSGMARSAISNLIK